MSYQTSDGRGSWDPHLSSRTWTCDCGHKNGKERHACYECRTLVTEREVEQR